MEQILVTIDDSQSLSNIRKAIRLLRGVVSATIVKNGQSVEEQQKAYVKDSLSKAVREVRLAKLEGHKLQGIDEFLSEMREV